MSDNIVVSLHGSLPNPNLVNTRQGRSVRISSSVRPLYDQNAYIISLHPTNSTQARGSNVSTSSRDNRQNTVHTTNQHTAQTNERNAQLNRHDRMTQGSQDQETVQSNTIARRQIEVAELEELYSIQSKCLTKSK